MFEINTIFLYKFGWVINHWSKIYPWLFHSPERIYSILYENDKIYFIKSKCFDTDRKSYPNRNSNFYDVSSYLVYDKNIEEKIEVKSNIELLNCIKKNNACVKEYQRHFKLSNILKK